MYFFDWRFISKSVSVLTSVAYSLASRNYIINTNNLPLYFPSLLLIHKIHCNKNFLCHSIDFLKVSSSNFVNGLFQDYIHYMLPLYTLIHIDGSVSPISTELSFFIPDLYICFTNNFSPIALSYVTEFFAIIKSLQFISTLQPNKFLIATDSFSCLKCLSFNVFKLSNLSRQK